jgi:beta-N-acetylhexosaminidase
MPETELRAGRITAAELGSALPGLRVVKLSPATTQVDLDSLASLTATAERIVVVAYVRRIEGQGRPAMPPHIAAWIDRLAGSAKVIVVAHGNPYLLRQLPSVGTYLTTYSVGDAVEHAAVQALLGRAPITGVVPVSLPGFFKLGDGIRR